MKVLFIGKSHLKYHDTHHSHDTWEIIASVSGRGYVDFDDKRIPFDEMTVLCIPPGVKHSRHSVEGCVDYWMWFHEFPADDKQAMILSDDEDRNILSILNVIYSMFHSSSPSKQEIIDSLFDSLKKMILSRSEKNKTDRRIERIKSEILQNFNNPDFSITSCLEAQGYCADHMRRIFIEAVGISPIRYLTEVRINAAKQILENHCVSQKSVSEACELSGFNDIGYFSKMFKKNTGITPSEYRKKQRS